MRIGIGLLLSIMFFSTISLSQLQGSKADKASKTEETIKKLEFELDNLFMNGKFEKYASYLTDDYLLTNPDGEVMTKEEILKRFGTGGTKGDSLLPSDLKVRVYNSTTAILTGHLTYKGHEKGLGSIHEAQFTKVFIKRNGKWLLVSNQGSQIISH